MRAELVASAVGGVVAAVLSLAGVAVLGAVVLALVVGVSVGLVVDGHG